MEKPIINSFNQIAPLITQEYRHYLPTAFDESLSLLEKVNKVIQKLNEIGLITNDVITQWNEVMEWVMNDGLTEDINTRLDEMVADGTMDTIINQNIFEQINKDIQGMIVSVEGKTTTEIQTIINDNVGQSTIFFPNTLTNVYAISQTIKIPSNTRIKIAKGVTLKLNPAINNPIFENENKLNGNTNIHINGGIFDVNGVNQNTKSPALSFHNVSDSSFENLVVAPTKRDNVYVAIGSFDLYKCDKVRIKNVELYDSGDEGLYLRECTHCEVSGGEYYNCTNGSGVASDLGKYNKFESILSYGNTGSNFSINSPYSVVDKCISKDGKANNGITLGHVGKPANYSVVTNCIVENNTQGIRVLASSSGVVVKSNIVRDNVGTAIGIGISDTSSDCIIVDNHVTNNYNGIYVSTVKKGNVVKGNFVKGNRSDGVVINETENSVIESNICENNTGFGIRLSANSKNNIISNNRCFDSQTTKTQQRGIYSDGSKNIFSNNILHGNSTTSLSTTTDNNVTNNMLSETDQMSVDVVLSTTQGTTTVTNGNITSASKVSIYAKSSAAVSRDVFVQSIGAGSLVLGHTITAGTDTVRVVIN